MFQCPRCTQPVNAPELAGHLVACPACEHQFVMPGGLILDSPRGVPQVVSSVLPPPAPPVVVFSQNYQPRLRSSGWFSRGFSTTAGVLLAAFLAAGLLCGGIALLVDRATSDTAAMTVKTRKQALASLRPYGIRELAQEVKSGPVGTQWGAIGPALTEDNKIVEVIVLFDVATIGDTTRWKVAFMSIDGEEIRLP